jgi:hypothetical protein
MAYIDGAFVSKQGIGLDTYKQVMEMFFGKWFPSI